MHSILIWSLFCPLKETEEEKQKQKKTHRGQQMEKGKKWSCQKN